MRARYPERHGYVASHGVPIYWEVHGEGDHTVLFLPTWQLYDSRIWKMQVPYFARHFRVVTYDAPGNGRSGRPASGYDLDRCAEDALAVMDATGTARASVVGLSRGTRYAFVLAAEHPERVERLALIATPGLAPNLNAEAFYTQRERYEGWEKYNAHYWKADFPRFADFFARRIFTEPHSTKGIEDATAWALDTTPEILIQTIEEWGSRRPLADRVATLRMPTLLIHGTEDAVRSVRLSEEVHAAIPGSTFVPMEGAGHAPNLRDPVKTNLLIRDFIAPEPPGRRRPWRRAMTRPRRALFVSSPIGLGHALRDVAIARELRALHPDLTIDWLAQDPVTRVLESRGERVHPASRHLANESAHLESEAGEHDLHVFQSWRNMDEILLSNFMVLHDVLDAEPYDLVVGDEAWEVDYYLHENPELKSTAFAWLTDFVGWLPMENDETLTADYNAEMIEQIARFPRVRDRAVFVGNRDDVVDMPFGPELPNIREWTARHFEFSGYILPFDPAEFADRDALRARLGFHADERVVFAAVGGSGVGHHLLRKVMSAAEETKRLVPDLRLIVVAGPRIDPASLPHPAGVEVRRFVPDLYAHFAACDLAVVQGGLTTCMELAATRRPFLYFPLRNHFEQNVHVPHRLARYGAGTRMDYRATNPEALAHAIADGLKRPVFTRDVETDGARRAAASIARLL